MAEEKETLTGKVPVTQSAKKSTKLSSGNESRAYSAMQMPSNEFNEFLFGNGMVKPIYLPKKYRLNDVVITAKRPSNLSPAGPKLEFSKWGQDKNYYDQGYHYGSNYHYGYLNDNGKGYHIKRLTYAGWGDERFWWYDERIEDYVEFVPVGYRKPSDVWRNYGSAAGEFANKYEAAINTCALIFATGGGGIVAVTLWRTILKMLLNMSMEIARQVITENKKIKEVDIADVVLEGIPAPKFIQGKLKEVLFSVVISAFQAGIDFNEKYGVVTLDRKEENDQKRDIATIFAQAVIKTIKVNIKDFKIFEPRLNLDEGELEAELIDRFYTFLISRGLFEQFPPQEDE